MKLETPRLVVVGNSDFVSDDGLRVAPTVINLASNCINWLLGRETLIKVPPKVKERMTLSLTLEQLNTIRVWVVIYLPLCIALLAGCGSKCPSGITEQDDGSCLRNHYGGTDNASDDTGGDDTSADDTGASAN